MKKLISMHFIGILALAILCSGCSTNRMAAGDPGAMRLVLQPPSEAM